MSDLLGAIRAAPDDDAPRLVWADAIGGERGELVVLQCMPATPERTARERALLAAHGVAWSELAGLATRCTFRRGFVASVAIDLATCAARAEEIVERAPVLDTLVLLCPECHQWEDGTFDGPDTVGLVRAVLVHPALRHITNLVVWKAKLRISPDRETSFQAGYGDEIVAAAAEVGRLQTLRSLAIVNSRTTARGVETIGRTGDRLEELVLAEAFGEWDWESPRPAPIAWPEDALPRLRKLRVRAIDDATRARLRPSIEIVVDDAEPALGPVDLS